MVDVERQIQIRQLSGAEQETMALEEEGMRWWFWLISLSLPLSLSLSLSTFLCSIHWNFGIFKLHGVSLEFFVSKLTTY